MLEDLVTGYLANVEASGAFEQGAAAESPTVIVWILHFLAQHFDKLGQVRTWGRSERTEEET